MGFSFMADAIKETKAQRVERLKREKNPWDRARTRSGDLLARVSVRFLRSGLGTYFRWWGVYTQGDGAGVVGGQGGEGRALPYFMVRIRVPNGLLQSHQLRTIADLTQKYARGIADLTVRQNIQLHWVTIESPAGSDGSVVALRLEHHGSVRRCDAQRYRVPAGRRGCGRDC